MTRTKIVAGNWKMNTNLSEGKVLLQSLKEENLGQGVVPVIIPPYTHLYMAVEQLKNTGLKVGAQNCSNFEKGAYTGEVSPSTLDDMGVEYVIIGHSERRAYYGENESFLAEKMTASLANHLTPIYCVGETLEERENNIHFDIIRKQIEGGLFHLSAAQLAKCVIAYEPVWAIGTGKTASPEQAQEIHAFIREVLTEKYGILSQQISMIYGGSVNDANANELFSQPDIDGGLVGGASLKADSFAAIINAMSALQNASH